MIILSKLNNHVSSGTGAGDETRKKINTRRYTTTQDYIVLLECRRDIL